MNLFSNKKVRLIIMIVILIIAVAAFITGMIIFPDQIITQIGGGGKTRMDKRLALLLPLALSGVFAVTFYAVEQHRLKSLFASIVGLIVFLLCFIVN